MIICTGGTATWIVRPVIVVCRTAPSLVKWLREHNSPGMIGIGKLHAGVVEPVVPWYRRVQAPPMRVFGQHCQGVMHYFFRHLHLRECQLDELWTFVAKKEAHLTPLEKLATIYGDAWVWIAFSAVDKLVPAWVVGKRTLRDARRLVLRLQAATDGHIPFFTSDALPQVQG